MKPTFPIICTPEPIDWGSIVGELKQEKPMSKSLFSDDEVGKIITGK